MKIAEIKNILNTDMCSKNKEGNYVARWRFFYSHGGTSEMFEAKVLRNIPTAKIIGSERVDKPFKGGGGVKSNSHFAVEFAV